MRQFVSCLIETPAVELLHPSPPRPRSWCSGIIAEALVTCFAELSQGEEGKGGEEPRCFGGEAAVAMVSFYEGLVQQGWR